MTNISLGYFKAERGNVGDDINPWLASRLMPDVTFGDSGTVMVGVGSILVAGRWDGFDRKVVVGSGARSKDRLPVLDDSWDVRFVRGPRSEAAIGRADVGHITDPALMLGLFEKKAAVRKGVGLVPYYQSSRRIWSAIAAQTGMRVISPELSPDDFIAQLSTCDVVLCEAMHGAIFADALRIPWKAISFQNRRMEGDTHVFKWSDWCESVDLTFSPLSLPLNPTREERVQRFGAGPLGKGRAAVDLLGHSVECAGLVRSAIRGGDFTLSSDAVYEDRLTRMGQVFSDLNREFR